MEEEKASGATSDRDLAEDVDRWEKEVADHGLFAATCNDHCILINVDHGSRLGKRICKRTGARLVTLLSGGELYSTGERAKPLEPPWVRTFLCTFHREPYIQSRRDRRCHIPDCFKNGTPLTLRGASAKRCQQHIEEALLSITRPNVRVCDEDMPRIRDPSPVPTASNSRRPSQTSAGSNNSGNLQMEKLYVLLTK